MEAFARLKARVNKGLPITGSEQPTPPTPPAFSFSRPGNNSSSNTTPAPTAATSKHYAATSRFSRQTAPKRPTTWPIRLESPRHKIQVTVHHYLVAKLQENNSQTPTDLHAWAFISSGFRPVAGGELVMVIKRRPLETPESYPADFLRICDTVVDRASSSLSSAGQRFVLRRWMLIGLDEPVFGRPDFRTIALGLRNSPLLGLQEAVALETNPVPHFYCLALNDEETAAARKGGVVRTLVSAEGPSPWFPFPFYVDRDRTPKLTAASMDRSIVAGNGFSRLEVTGLNVTHGSEGQVTLHIPLESFTQFKAAILRKRITGPGSSLLIETQMHDACECVYMWTPGADAGIRTIKNHAKLDVAANFLLLSFNQAKETVELVEDGLFVMLNSANSALFFQAASQGQDMDVTLKPGGTLSFRMTWPPFSPPGAFSKTSGTAGRIYLPARGSSAQPPKQEGHVQTSVVLLRDPHPGKANIDLLARFIEMAELAVIAAIPAPRPSLLPNGCGITAKFRIPKIDHNSFGVQGTFPSREAAHESSALLTRLQKVVQGLEAPEGIVYGDYVEFQLMFACWGFDWSWLN